MPEGNHGTHPDPLCSQESGKAVSVGLADSGWGGDDVGGHGIRKSVWQ